MEGYIKLHRKIMNSAVWQDPFYFKLWMYCLMKASHKEREVLHGNQVIKLEPGQFITGRKSLTDDLNKGMKPSNLLNETTWWRYLNNLEKLEMLHIKKTNKYSIVSIVNWCMYQENEQQMHNKRTTDAQQMHTNKNVKNVNNDKEKDYTSKIKDLLSRYVSIADFNKLNKEYWDVIRETRKHGEIAKSVIYKNMKKWEKYDPIVVKYSLKTHIEAHVGKKEEYTIGIMRGTTKEEAEDRLNTNVIPFKKNEKTKEVSGRDVPNDFVFDINAGEK